MLHGVGRLIPFLCSASGWNQSWVDSSWTLRPDTSRNGPSWGGEPNTCNNENTAPNDESRVDQSWLSNAPRMQATTRTNQSNSYLEQDNNDDNYEDLPDSYTVDDEDYSYATQSWLTPSPSYDTVRQPEWLWQPYHMEVSR